MLNRPTFGVHVSKPGEFFATILRGPRALSQWKRSRYPKFSGCQVQFRGKTALDPFCQRPLSDLFLMERRLAHEFTGLWQIIRDPDEFLESMKANLWSQTHGLSVFTWSAPDKFQECGIETGNRWKSAVLGYLSNRLIGGDQHSLDMIYTFLQQILVKSTPVSFFTKCIRIIRM